MKRALAIVLLVSAASFSAAQSVPEPDDYRMDHYRAPVPESLEGALVIDADRAYELWTSKEAVFVDVLPQAPKPANLPEGTIWRDKPRYSIPGALWLPNVGYGALAPETETYFRAGLHAATQADPSKPIVIFCLDECWMSWNAAKRAISWGYQNVIWLPEGTDGWQAWNYPVERLKPFQTSSN